MCWAVVIDGKAIHGRDDLESEIGMEVLYDDDGPRLDNDHCLCSVDVPATMCAAGYWVRSDPHDVGGWVAKMAE